MEISQRDDQDLAEGWQFSPNRRGTLEIILSCLLTILACTWSIQHLNLPAPDTRPLAILGRKAKWFVITVIFPEFILIHAILDHVAARETMNEMEKASSLVHVIRPNRPRLKDFRKKFQGSIVAAKERRGSDTIDSEPPLLPAEPLLWNWTLTHSYFANMGGFRLIVSPNDHQILSQIDNTHATVENPHPTTLVMNASQLALLLNDGSITEIQPFSKEDIKDKSKTDAFTKAIAAFQILWLAISIPARAIQHISTSQLEILTLAFAVCSLLTYAFCWHKPQDVGTPFIMKAKPGIFYEPGHGDRIIKLQQLQRDSFWKTLSTSEDTKDDKFRDRIPNDSISAVLRNMQFIILLWFVVTVAFGAMHLIAWDFTFPTLAELWIWRSSALIATCLPAITLILNGISAGLSLGERHDSQRFASVLFQVCEQFESLQPEEDRVFSQIPKYVKDSIIHERSSGVINTWTGLFNRYGIGHDALLPVLEALENGSTGTFTHLTYPRFDMELQRLRDIIASKRAESSSSENPSSSRTSAYNLGADRFDTFPKIMSQERRMHDAPLQGQAALMGHVRRFGGLLGDWISKYWPRRAFLLTLGVFYVYARFSLIAVAISSLRAMDDSVFDATWPWL